MGVQPRLLWGGGGCVCARQPRAPVTVLGAQGCDTVRVGYSSEPEWYELAYAPLQPPPPLLASLTSLLPTPHAAATANKVTDAMPNVRDPFGIIPAMGKLSVLDLSGTLLLASVAVC